MAEIRVEVKFPSVTSLEEAKDFLNVGEFANDKIISQLILTAEEIIQRQLGKLLKPTEVKFFQEGVETVEDCDDIEWWPYTPFIYVSKVKEGKITYMAGYTDPPATLRMSILHLIYKLYYNRSSPTIKEHLREIRGIL